MTKKPDIGTYDGEYDRLDLQKQLEQEFFGRCSDLVLAGLAGVPALIERLEFMYRERLRDWAPRAIADLQRTLRQLGGGLSTKKKKNAGSTVGLPDQREAALRLCEVLLDSRGDDSKLSEYGFGGGGAW